MKVRIVCLLCIIGALLSACGAGNGIAETGHGDPSNQEVSTTPSSKGNIYSAILPGWEICKGEAAITGVEDLTYLENIALDDDGLAVNGKAYTPLMNKPKFATTSGWRIDLSAMHAQWRTEDGYIVLQSSDDDPLVICLYDQASGKILCYLRQDISEWGVGALGLESFDVFYNDGIISIDEQVKNIWHYHTGEDAFQTGVTPLDGDWRYYTLSLVYKNCSALQYEINLAVCDGFLYMENLHEALAIHIPTTQVMP